MFFWVVDIFSTENASGIATWALTLAYADAMEWLEGFGYRVAIRSKLCYVSAKMKKTNIMASHL